MFYAGAKVVFNFTNITPSASFRTAGKLRSHLGHAIKVLPCDYLIYMFYVYIRYILYIYIYIYIYI